MKAFTRRTRSRPIKWLRFAAVGLLPTAMSTSCVGKIGAPSGATGNDVGKTGPGSGTGAGSGTGGGTSGPCVSAASRRVRRLSQREYFHVVGDLLGSDLAALGK